MKINVSGSIELGQNFQTYVENEFKKEADKYLDHAAIIDVHGKKQGDLFFVSIIMDDLFKKGVNINAEAKERDIYKSFDEAFKKLTTQFLKEKDKMITERKKSTMKND